MKHLFRELCFIQLNDVIMKLIVFTNVLFININLTFQIDYVICLFDVLFNANIIHWLFIKCKRMIKSVLAFELYEITHDLDVIAVLKTISNRILNISISMIICVDFESLYDCLIKLRSTQEKQLMINFMCLCQFYERRKITKICWIDDNKNPIDVMIKSKICTTLQNLMNSNKISLNAKRWIKKDEMNIKNEWWMNFRFSCLRFFFFEVASVFEALSHSLCNEIFTPEAKSNEERHEAHQKMRAFHSVYRISIIFRLFRTSYQFNSINNNC